MFHSEAKSCCSHLQCIVEGLFGSLIGLPSLNQVHCKPHVVTENPIIWEKLVHNFPHFGCLRGKNVGAEVQTHKEHCCLVGQCC